MDHPLIENVPIGQYLKNIREKAEVKQLDLARKLGYESAQFVSLIECGRSKVPMNVLGAIFVILKVSAKEQKKVINAITNHFAAGLTAEIEQGKKELQ